MKNVFLCSVFFVIAEAAYCQSDFNIAMSTIPVASSDEIKQMRQVIDFQNHVVGFYKSTIMCAAKGSIGKGKNWFPQSNKPETVCGKYVNFFIEDARGIENGGFARRGKEYDWNIDVIPSEPFQKFLSPNYTKNTIQFEITPDESLFRSTYFSKSGVPSNRETMCATGPWVLDEGHDENGKKLEIHPSQLLWWQEKRDETVTKLILMALQDDSERFNKGFDCDGVFVGNRALNFEPWVKSPLLATFKVAFIIPISDFASVNSSIGDSRNNSTINKFYPSILTINTLQRRKVNKFNAEDDIDDGYSHRLLIDGKPIVIVDENNIDNEIKVEFTDIKRTTAGVSGFVTLNTSVGNSTSDKDGYHIISILLKRGGFESDNCVSERTHLEGLKNNIENYKNEITSIEQEIVLERDRNEKKRLRAHKGNLLDKVNYMKEKDIPEATKALETCRNQ